MSKYILKDKIVIITGAAKGIGKAAAQLLAESGAHVIIADVDPDGEKTATEIGGIFVKTDISSPEQVENLKGTALEKYGRIDVLINNAARQDVFPLFDTSPERFRDIIFTNLCGTFNCIRIIGEVMEPGSRILNCLSVHHDVPRRNKYAYDASKAGLAMLTKETALEFAERGITVNGISYGAVKTPMNADWTSDPEKSKAVSKNIPLGWIAEDYEIAGYMKSVIEDFSDHATGTIFTIDGGRSLL